MDCRSFKKKHLAYLDDTLVPGGGDAGTFVRVKSALNQDASIRRSLLVVQIHLFASAGFASSGHRLVVGGRDLYSDIS
jgi:hypothetical protein